MQPSNFLEANVGDKVIMLDENIYGEITNMQVEEEITQSILMSINFYNFTDISYYINYNGYIIGKYDRMNIILLSDILNKDT